MVNRSAARWDLYLAGSHSRPLDPPVFRPYWENRLPDAMAEFENKMANAQVWANGPRVGRTPILRVTDPGVAEALVIEMYHDYPSDDLFDAIDSRDCA